MSLKKNLYLLPSIIFITYISISSCGDDDKISKELLTQTKVTEEEVEEVEAEEKEPPIEDITDIKEQKEEVESKTEEEKSDVTETKNNPPNASASANPTSGVAPLSVYFSGSGSDIDGKIISYKWDFGDGNNSSSQNPSHTYQSAGNYTIVLTVTDDDGAKGKDTISVKITEIISGGSTPIEALENFKKALSTGNLENIIEQFDIGAQEKFRNLYKNLKKEDFEKLNDALINITKVFQYETIAEYRLVREEDGRSITYYIYFYKEKGKWKIHSF